MNRKRRRWTAKDKLKILREAQDSGASISEVCRRHGISSGLYYKWQERAEAGALQSLNGKREDRPSVRELRLQCELERMKSVIAEITAENIDLKKNLGE